MEDLEIVGYNSFEGSSQNISSVISDTGQGWTLVTGNFRKQNGGIYTNQNAVCYAVYNAEVDDGTDYVVSGSILVRSRDRRIGIAIQADAEFNGYVISADSANVYRNLKFISGSSTSLGNYNYSFSDGEEIEFLYVQKPNGRHFFADGVLIHSTSDSDLPPFKKTGAYGAVAVSSTTGFHCMDLYIMQSSSAAPILPELPFEYGMAGFFAP